MSVRDTRRWAAIWIAIALAAGLAQAQASGADVKPRRVNVALVQFDSVPEQTQRNLKEMERLARTAVEQGARWVMFHEGCLTDYTPRLDELAEPVPDGSSCRRMAKLAQDLNCFISFGMSERDGVRQLLLLALAGGRKAGREQ